MAALARNPWLGGIEPHSDAKARLFCFAHAGGTAAVFRRWREKLAALGLELCGVQLPGRFGRMNEPPMTRVGPLIESLTVGLRGFLDRPFALFGHSLGAVIAFEWARALQQQGTAPLLLFVAGRACPGYEPPGPMLHGLPDHEFWHTINTVYHGVPPAVAQEQELLDRLLPTLRADMELLETYVCPKEPKLACSIAAFGAENDPNTPAASLTAWGGMTSSTFTTRFFPGGHFFLDANLPELLAEIGSHWGQALRQRERPRDSEVASTAG